jgi:hypothetical protein
VKKIYLRWFEKEEKKIRFRFLDEKQPYDFSITKGMRGFP